MGSVADLRPVGPRKARDLECDLRADLRSGQHARHRRARVQPGDRGRVSDRARRSSPSRPWRRSTRTGSRRRRSSTTTVFTRWGRSRSGTPATLSYGPIDLRDALKVSSDVFFYTLGGRLQENIDDDGDEFIQDWAKSLGFGDVTGIDVPGEALGRVPTPEWRNELFEDGNTDRPWSVGDNINLSVGQGDLLAAPLQLAVAYATLGNGGTVVTPHVGLRTRGPGRQGGPGDRAAARRARSRSTRPGVSRSWTGSTRRRWSRAEPPTPSSASFPVDIAGKTGTAETIVDRRSRTTRRWYAALMPADDPEVAVVYTIEKGGFGVDSAAPAAKQILEEYARKYLSVSQRQIDEAAATPTDSTGTVVAE